MMRRPMIDELKANAQRADKKDMSKRFLTLSGLAVTFGFALSLFVVML